MTLLEILTTVWDASRLASRVSSSTIDFSAQMWNIVLCMNLDFNREQNTDAKSMVPFTRDMSVFQGTMLSWNDQIQGRVSGRISPASSASQMLLYQLQNGATAARSRAYKLQYTALLWRIPLLLLKIPHPTANEAKGCKDNGLRRRLSM